MKTRLLRLFCLVLLLATMATALFVGVRVSSSNASACSQWYHCPITQTFSKRIPEHGVDLATNGMIITARLQGVVTFVGRECWENPCIEDITWRLSHPWLAKGFRYMYVQIRQYSSFVHVGQFIPQGTLLGYSGRFIEFGLSTSDAYGVHGNWYADWTVDPRFLL